MAIDYIKMMSWAEYRDRRTGANIDTRPTEVIMAEIEALHNGGK